MAMVPHRLRKIQDQWNIISHFTVGKAWNALKILSSFYYSRMTRQPVQWGKPISVSIEPTTACNLGCPECPSGLRSFTRPTGNLKADVYRPMIDELSKHVSYLIFYFQGEPFINPQFLDMVEYAGSKGIYTATSTNAHFLDDERAKATVKSGLDRIIISIDGTTQETYENYRRNGTLSKVLEGTENLLKWKRKMKSKKPYVIFQFLVVRPNEHQIPDIKKLGREIGVDEVKFKTAQIYDYKNGNPLIPTIDKYSRYKRQPDGTYEIKNKLLNHCWQLWHSCVITWDGKVVPCCFDKDASHRMGDLQQHSFEEIWEGKTYREFRKSILKSRKEIDICKNCTEGTKVWA